MGIIKKTELVMRILLLIMMLGCMVSSAPITNNAEAAEVERDDQIVASREGDIIIAAAFPSNTARSGVLYPITLALSRGSGSKVEDGTQKKMGSYLMMNCIAGLTLSSSLWFTGMAANPVGAKMAADAGIEGINFGSWYYRN